MKKSSLYLASSLVLACLTATSGAHAAGMDYGSLEQLFGEPVTTSATGQPQRSSEVPADMEIITADEIRRSGATSIPEVLSHVSGLDVREYSSADTQISIRGYATPESARLLVLINGRQVYLDSYGYTAWSTLPVELSEIRQIEVVKGPSTALFGFNAVGGVINIITYDPLYDQVNHAEAYGGTQATVGGSGVATFHFGDDFGLRLSGGISRNNESTAPGNATLNAMLVNPFTEKLSADTRYQVNPHTQVSAEATWSHVKDVEQIGFFTQAVFNYNTNSLKFGVDSDTDYGLVHVDAYRNAVNYDVELGGAPVGIKNTIYIVQANDLIKLDAANILRLGLEYRHNDIAGDIFPGHTGEEVMAANAMWNWQIMPELSLTNAVRVDYLSLYQEGSFPATAPYSQSQFNNASATEYSFNSGLVYKPTGEDTVRLLVSRGIQAPSLLVYGSASQIALPGLTLSYFGNPDVKAASVMNYELAYNRKLENLHSSLRASVYYQETSHLFEASALLPLTFDPAIGLYGVSQNIGSTRAWGGELGIKGAADGFRWDASYSFIKIHDDLIAGLGALSFKDGTPTSIVDVKGGYSWGKFDIDAAMRWQSAYTDIQNGPVSAPVDAYFTLDARLAYHLTDNFTVSVDGTQLNDARIYRTAVLPVERRILIRGDINL